VGDCGGLPQGEENSLNVARRRTRGGAYEKSRLDKQRDAGLILEKRKGKGFRRGGDRFSWGGSRGEGGGRELLFQRVLNTGTDGKRGVWQWALDAIELPIQKARAGKREVHAFTRKTLSFWRGHVVREITLREHLEAKKKPIRWEHPRKWEDRPFSGGEGHTVQEANRSNPGGFRKGHQVNLSTTKRKVINRMTQAAACKTKSGI